MHEPVLKKIFQRHPGLLRRLLNDFLPIEYPVLELEFLTEGLYGDNSGFLCSIALVKCRDSRGDSFIVDVLLQRTPVLMRRVFMNAARIYCRNGQTFHGPSETFPVRTLCLLGYNQFPIESAWVHQYEMRTEGTAGESLGEVFFTFVELLKWSDPGVPLDNSRDLWMLFFTKPGNLVGRSAPGQSLRSDEMWQAVRESGHWHTA